MGSLKLITLQHAVCQDYNSTQTTCKGALHKQPRSTLRALIWTYPTVKHPAVNPLPRVQVPCRSSHTHSKGPSRKRSPMWNTRQRSASYRLNSCRRRRMSSIVKPAA